MTNTTDTMLAQALYIGKLVRYLEGRLNVLTPEQQAKLESKTTILPEYTSEQWEEDRDRPLSELLEREVRYRNLSIPLEKFVALANDSTWALAHLVVDERAALARSDRRGALPSS
jgi:hypothetical protein